MRKLCLLLSAILTACGSTEDQTAAVDEEGSGGTTTHEAGASGGGSGVDSGASDAGAKGTAGGGGRVGTGGSTGTRDAAQGSGGAAQGSGGGAGSGGVTALGCPSSQAPGTWQNVTPPGMKMSGDYVNGPITADVDVVRPSDVYAQVQYDGTWKSTDCGLTWAKVSRGTAPDSGRQWYTAIDANPSRDPATSPTMYTTYGFGYGAVWKSVNGGVDWTDVWTDRIYAADGHTNISKDVGADVTGVMLVDASGPDHLIAYLHGYGGSGGNNGVFESTDGGGKWTIHQSSYFAFQPHGDAVFPYDASTWIVSHGYPSVFYRTTDAGATWKLGSETFVAKTIGRAYAIAGSTIYAGSDYTGDLYRSTDKGMSWSGLSVGNNISWVVATGTKVYASNGYVTSPHILHASLSNDTVWANDGIPNGMTWSGSQPPAVLFDGSHYVLVAAQEEAGLWRYVEP